MQPLIKKGNVPNKIAASESMNNVIIRIIRNHHSYRFSAIMTRIESKKSLVPRRKAKLNAEC